MVEDSHGLVPQQHTCFFKGVSTIEATETAGSVIVANSNIYIASNLNTRGALPP